MQEEFQAIYLPTGGGRRGAPKNGPSPGEIPYERKVPKGRLPNAVDWRHAGLDAVVKDQAACGSCWAFGTTGMLQGAYWMATGAGPPAAEVEQVGYLGPVTFWRALLWTTAGPWSALTAQVAGTAASLSGVSCVVRGWPSVCNHSF